MGGTGRPSPLKPFISTLYARRAACTFLRGENGRLKVLDLSCDVTWRLSSMDVIYNLKAEAKCIGVRMIAKNIFYARKKDLRKAGKMAICPTFSFNNIPEHSS